MSRRLLLTFRPYVCADCRARIAGVSTHSRQFSTTTPAGLREPSLDNVDTVERRILELGGRVNLEALFPRLHKSKDIPTLSAADFSSKYGGVFKADNQELEMVIYGRVTSQRILGSKLLHLQLATGANRMSTVPAARVQLNHRFLSHDKYEPGIDGNALKEFSRKLKRGDWMIISGCLAKDRDGQTMLNATRFPGFLAPALQAIPEQLTDPEVRMRNRHADQIVDSSARDIIYLRSRLITEIRKYLQDKVFLEVSTPLLVAGAGGAVARPFQTVATEFPSTKLNLRVAPELFLKRMIVGGMPRVFEIGPAFRNEGVDATHNPEFTICEFYAVMKTLDDLIGMTEQLFARLEKITTIARKNLRSIPPSSTDFTAPFRRLEFIPSIEVAVKKSIPTWQFPDLSQPDALSTLVETADTLRISLPLYATLPRLLDTFAEHFLEPQCVAPTFITHHPECMSPLSKSFLREPTVEGGTRHRVSARAELFIAGREYVNCYEEENSPVEQRRKFEEQLTHRAGPGEEASETHGVVDESYVRALEWGMPPTGGWGCGVDRIVMLFGGKSRIADVLPFGSLRNVVGLTRSHSAEQTEKAKVADVQSEGSVREESLGDEQGIAVQSSVEAKALPNVSQEPGRPRLMSFKRLKVEAARDARDGVSDA